MASFRCILTLADEDFPVVQCTYEFSQSTTDRGRVTTKVRSGLLTLHLDVPDSNKLLVWGSDPHKKLSGHLIFNAIDNPVSYEKLTFEDGLCVSYKEAFYSGAAPEGAYRCLLQIAAAKLALGIIEKDNTWAQTR